MKWIRDNIVAIILSGVCIILLVLILSIIRKSQNPGPSITAVSDAYQKAYQAQDELIKVYRENSREQAAIIEDHKKTDSLLLIRLQANQPKYIANDKRLKDVAVAVHNLDREQLRREYASY